MASFNEMSNQIEMLEFPNAAHLLTKEGQNMILKQSSDGEIYLCVTSPYGWLVSLILVVASLM